MKKGKGMARLVAGSLAAAVIAVGGAASVQAECTDAATFMSEGISYGCEQGVKAVTDTSDLRLSTEALMAEGIYFPDSVIASSVNVIDCDHQSFKSDVEDCYYEGISLTDNRKSSEDSKQILASVQSASH